MLTFNPIWQQMDKTKKIFSKLLEIESIDPKILAENNVLKLCPYYWNYPFITNFLGIFIFTYILFLKNDSLINLACYVGIGVFAILVITSLKYYNTISIDIEKKTITIQSSPLSILQRKRKVINFDSIKNVTVKSNYNSTGFWYMNRRYYIPLLLKDSDEMKIIGSSKNETAIEVTENINSILREV